MRACVRGYSSNKTSTRSPRAICITPTGFKVAAKPATPVDNGLVADLASTGEPPLIPHEVDPSDGGEDCLGCHEGGEDAPIITSWHETLTDCRQCQVVSNDAVSDFKVQY
jgi:hypothetical protein